MTPLPAPVAGVAWRHGTADDLDAVVAVSAAADAVDDPEHPRTRDEIAGILGVVDPGQALVLGERDGRPVAGGILFRPGHGPVRLVGAVVPEERGRGIGRALIAAQIAAVPLVEPDATECTLRSVGGGGAAGLARRWGFEVARVFLSMRRDLRQPIAAPPTPPGLRIRAFDPDLDDPVRLAKNDAFLDHWNGTAEDPDQWRTRMLGEALDRAGSRIAVDERGAVAGFAVAHRVEDRPDRLYIPLVGTAREHRRRGVAGALLAQVLKRAAAGGYAEATLDVDSTSPTGADRVYTTAGFVETVRATIWSRPVR